MCLEPAPFTLRAAHKQVAQELHLDLFKPSAAAAFAAATAGIEGKRAGCEPLRHCIWLGCKKLTNAVVKPKVKNRGRTRCPGQHRLINHHDVADTMRAGDRPACSRFPRRAVVLRRFSWLSFGS